MRVPSISILVPCLCLLAVAGASGKAPEPRTEAPVSAVDRDPATGEVWIGTLGSGLVRSSAGRFDRFTQFNSGLAGDVLFDVKVWRGRIFAATTRGISDYDPPTERWSLHLERRGDVAPTAVVRLVVYPPDTSRRSEASSLFGCAADGRRFRYDSGAEGWALSAEATARAACESARDEDPDPGFPRAPERDGPASAKTTAIGIVMPMSRTIAVPGSKRPWPDERVDKVAIEELLARRKERGAQPIELSPSAFMYERHCYGTPEDTLALLALRAEVAGAVGHGVPHGSVESILAERLGFPIVDAAPGEPETDGEDPWVFRCDRYGHEGQAAVLDALLAKFDRPRLAIVRTPGADASRRLDFWARRAADRGAAIAVDVAWDPATEDLDPVLAKLRGAKVAAILSWGDAPSSSVLLGGMRRLGMDAAILGGPQIASEEFARAAPPDAGTVLAVAPCRHAPGDPGPEPASLRDRSLEAAAHLLAAVESAARDRKAVRGMLQRMRSESVARLIDGAWRPFSYGQSRAARGAPLD